ncbi:MAG: hypothetical protein ACTSPI_17425 [Candidatus Heimdallarchaeaceae archaeon]
MAFTPLKEIIKEHLRVKSLEDVRFIPLYENYLKNTKGLDKFDSGTVEYNNYLNSTTPVFRKLI